MLQPGRLKRLVKINNSCINSFYLLMSTIHCKVFCSTIFTTGKVHDLSFSSGKLESFLDFMGGIFFFLELEPLEESTHQRMNTLQAH